MGVSMQANARNKTDGWNVLVVEDDARIASLLGATLATSFSVRVVYSAEEALAALDDGEEFDLVLSDYSLPGKSGLDLLSMVRTHRPSTRRLMLTGESSREVHERATNECAVHRFLLKPCDPNGVLEACEDSLLDLKRERAAEARSRELTFSRAALADLNHRLEERLDDREDSLAGLQKHALELASARDSKEIATLTEMALTDLLGGREVKVVLGELDGLDHGVPWCVDLLGFEGGVHGRVCVIPRGEDDELDLSSQAQLEAVASTASVALDNEARRVERDRAQHSAILALARLAEKRDDDTGRHLERVSGYSRLIAVSLRARGFHQRIITDVWIEDLVRSAPLHDVGKVAIPDSILKKPGPLTNAEREVMKTHTTIGAATLEAAHVEGGARGFLEMGRDIALCHHERWDGEGYPRGTSGEEIPLEARILSLADVYDALTTKRPYKEAWPHEEAMSWIMERGGTQFDPEVVASFLALAEEFDAMRERLADDELGTRRS
jgi:response regulator RpfG family c-di-GMP phosphodiesterase